MQQDQVRAALEAAHVVSWEWDTATGDVTWLSGDWSTLGVGNGELPGTYDTFVVHIHPEDRARAEANITRAAAERTPYQELFRLQNDAGTAWVSVQGGTHPEKQDKMVGVLARVAEQIHHQGQLQDALTSEQRARTRLDYLLAATEVLSASLERDEIAHALANLAVPRLADWCVVYELRRATLERIAVAHAEEGHEAAVQAILQGSIPLAAKTPAVHVATTRETVVLGEVDEATIRAVVQDRAAADVIVAAGVASSILVPIAAGSEVLGVLTFVASRGRDPYTPEDVAMAEDLARRAAVAMQHAGKYQKERASAEALQRAIQPKILPIVGVELTGRYRAADVGAEVGGDWYDAFTLPDGRVGIVVGDVGGHDVAAASVMGQISSALRAYAREGHPPCKVMELLDGLLDDYAPETTATAVYGVYTPRDGHLEWANAGHPPILVLAEDAAYHGEGRGPMLGAGGDGWEPNEVTLQPGETVLLYSDGLIEVRGEDITEGMDRLRAEVLTGRTLEELADDLVAGLGTQTREDDVCILALRRPTDVQTDLPGGTESVSEARSFVETVTSKWGDEDLTDKLLLLTSELVTNAVLHARSKIQLHLSRRSNRVLLEVTDDSRSAPVTRHYSSEATVGRGLLLVETLSLAWGVRLPHGAGGKTVWCEVPLQGGESAWTEWDLSDLTGFDPDNADEAPETTTSEAAGEDPESADEARTTRITIVNYPVDEMQKYGEHHEGLRRELVLSAGETGKASTTQRLNTSTEELQKKHPYLNPSAAAEDPRETRTTLTYDVPNGAGAAAATYLELLEEADEHSRTGEGILHLAAPAGAVELRTWYLTEFTRQEAGEAPTPWPGYTKETLKEGPWDPQQRSQ